MIATTLARAVSREGVGIHSGATCRVRLEPADRVGGIRFRRGQIWIAARPENVVDTRRCTVLGVDGARVSTVEHLLSACYGLGITDLTVVVEGEELPIGDGSAVLWVEALQEGGRAPLGERPDPVPWTTPSVLAGVGGAFLGVFPSDSLRVCVGVHFDHPLLGAQSACFGGSEDYVTQVAGARTFGFWEEIEALRAAGLARGGTLENALVVYPDRFSAPLRFSNELARHKLLDLLGDLYLAGPLPPVQIVAIKPSHALNTAFAAQLSRS